MKELDLKLILKQLYDTRLSFFVLKLKILIVIVKAFNYEITMFESHLIIIDDKIIHD